MKSSSGSVRRRPSNLYARRGRGELRLTQSAGGAADLAGRKARLADGELDVDRAELGGLAGTAERILAAELFQLFYLGAAGHLQRSPDRPPGSTSLSPEQTLRFKWMVAAPRTTFVITYSPSRSNRRDGHYSFWGNCGNGPADDVRKLSAFVVPLERIELPTFGLQNHSSMAAVGWGHGRTPIGVKVQNRYTSQLMCVEKRLEATMILRSATQTKIRPDKARTRQGSAQTKRLLKFFSRKAPLVVRSLFGAKQTSGSRNQREWELKEAHISLR